MPSGAVRTFVVPDAYAAAIQGATVELTVTQNIDFVAKLARERTSRYVLLANPPSRKAEPTEAQLRNWLSSLPTELSRTLTQDTSRAILQPPAALQI